ncbi:glycosyl hydrolase family 18 protein [Janthinobacterium sp.]|uniref:glycosyl hydrolase family 18 protein n=1 Tax=Janthinobacterium sp. TaxID=1871054 RepID=UPI00293D5B60|nr:glycosyl hydrolase family 18 protein [Janthinobacterium sp.]
MLCLSSGGILAACGGGGGGDAPAAQSKTLAATLVSCAAWQDGGSYTAGTVVNYLGANYTALVTQTDYAGAGWNPASTPSLWSAGGSCGAPTPTPTPPTPTPTHTPTPPTPTPPTPTPTPASCNAAWSADTAYNGGVTVTYLGANYTSNYWTKGDAPATHSGSAGQPWTKVGDCNVTPTPTPTPPTPTPTPPTPTPTPTPPTPTPTPTPTPVGGREVGSYFAQWGVYDRDYEVANIHSSGVADKLTFINYAFGNVYAKNGAYECGMITKAEQGSSNPNSPDAGTGGDAEADYIRTPKRTVDGQAIPWDAPLSGNFAQFKKLKALHPNLKVFISLGGWTWSKNFSAAASTDALRKKMVGSCIDIFIKGNLPVQGGRGGAGVAKGVFDGIDIDWEYPVAGGQPYNGYSPADKHNFTLLMAEFRSQLDAVGAADNKRYLLTAAIGAGKDKIDNTEPALYAPYMDWVNVMTYDFHGAWENTTNFNAQLFADPADISVGVAREYVGDKAIQYLINAGMPRNKLMFGIPFYGRGWTGVPAGPSGNGLYQSGTGGAPGAYETGIEDYRILVGKAGTRYYHPVTKQLFMYTGAGGQWWSYDDPTVIATKVQYIKDQGLRGAFSWELDGDANGVLATEVWKAH